MVATDKVKFKVPNWLLRGILSALFGGILTYLGIAIHDVNQRPLAVPTPSAPATPATPPAPTVTFPADGGRR
jgi:hypothetical protein